MFNSSRLRFVPAAVCVFGVLPAAADVLDDRDNAPLAGIYQFVDSTEGADLAPKGALRWSLLAMASSHAVSSQRATELLVFDGETDRLELGLRFGVSQRLELGVQVPWIQHSAGRLDGLIDGWHDTFGLPGGSRESRESDLLEYRYVDGGGTRLNVVDDAGGLGDLRLVAGWQLAGTANHRRALRFGVTVPTGAVEDLTGSDAATVSLGIAGDVSEFGSSGRWSGFYRAHATWVGEPGLLADRYREWVGHLGAGLGWRASAGIVLRAQILARSATHDSTIETLGEPAVTLTFGGTIALGRNYELALAVGEDIKVESSPDVSFMLSLRYRPGAR